MNKTVLNTVLSARQDHNIKFQDLQNLMLSLDFKERINGDHFIYKRNDIPERINIQPLGNKAKAYQVRQIRSIIIKYQLGGERHV